ncbi:MAG: hypothetical protein H6728_06795 [Myxococcales bacterium]|nr:hypothetical protein [Myxococcales bacterium]MCB9642769.1 hypothetical protein [Myxococcales bacterium]
MPPSSHHYQAYYCEENVWKLAQEPRFSTVEGYAVFISNPDKTCALWHQRASESLYEPIVWDYHVIYLAATGPVAQVAWQVWDLDTRLGCPVSFVEYIEQTFSLTMALPPQYLPLFRLVPRELFVERFFSNREHMLDDESHFRQPPPAWPAPAPTTQDDPLPLLRLVDMQDDFVGDILDLYGLSERFR